MKLLAVFDGTNEAELNLRTALKVAYASSSSPPNSQDHSELLIVVLELLREDKPLDDFLGEMEKATAQSLSRAETIVAEAGAGLTTIAIKVLRGMELEAAEVVVQQAKKWKADQIYMSLGEEAASYLYAQAALNQQARFFSNFANKLRTYFKLKSPKKAGVAPDFSFEELAYSARTISVVDFIPIAPCPVKVTYQGEVIFSLHVHRSQAKLKPEES